MRAVVRMRGNIARDRVRFRILTAMAGELSPDRLFYWDGARWVSALSPDGAWRWDGAAWQPAARSSGGRLSRRTGIIAGIVIVSLVLAGVGVYFAAGALSKASQRVLHSTLLATCSSPLAQAGAALKQGDSLCGGTLGTEYFLADCTQAETQPTGTTAWSKSYVGGTEGDWTKTTLNAGTQGCELSPDPDIYLTLETQAMQPPTAVVVADFTYDGNRSDVGLRLACSSRQASCLDISMYPDGFYDLGEIGPNGDWDSLGKGVAIGATFHSGSTNRLIMRLSGRQVTVILNGRVVVQTDTRRDEGYGYVNFYVDNRDDPTTETVWLQRMYVFDSRR
ncbi:MAG TPA: hypothetical protein VFL29_12980 [Candidatus Dormibacteraeota bacterium]|nr:hypothetical protein [Candidatus Dormibacteraeota bacterium]